MSSSPLFLRCHKGELPEVSASDDEASEATTRQDGDETKEVTDRKNSTGVSPPSANLNNSEKLRKRKHIEEDEESLGTSKATDVPQPETVAMAAAPVAVTL
jgi:hypothetical protein